jgi:DNA-binding SARP family transcriptional activator
MPERLQILTLGGLKILIDGSAVRGLASRKAEALLVYLAVQSGSPSRETLATLLWDDRSLQGSLANLSVLLTSLRKVAGQALRIDRDAVSLEADAPWECDALEFERSTTVPASAGEIPPAKAGHAEMPSGSTGAFWKSFSCARRN